MESFVVRIYRFRKDNPRHLVGIVEMVRGEQRGKMAFSNMDDLWEILNSQMSEPALPEQKEVRQGRSREGENRAKK